MNKKIALEKQYQAPLPVAIQPLPPVVLHNPLSIAYLLYVYFFSPIPEQIRCDGVLSSCAKYVKVVNEMDCQRLWSMGFFGKGIYSRSEPFWWVRTSRRLGLNISSKLTPEEVTHARREQRLKFKSERARAEVLETERRRLEDAGNTAEAEVLVTRIAEITANNERLANSNDLSPMLAGFVRPEDEAILIDGQLPQLEYMQLMPVEAFFLSFSLNALTIKDSSSTDVVDPVSLFKTFCRSDSRFASSFAAYYYYRSLGWCVRSGVKFGCDYVVYNRGPPFAHAEFCLMLMPSGEEPAAERPWWWNTAVGRVIGGVKKTLVFVYIKASSQSVDDLESEEDIRKYISTFAIQEVVYRRWIPGRNRD